VSATRILTTGPAPPVAEPRFRNFLLLLGVMALGWYVAPGVYLGYGFAGTVSVVALICVLALVLRGEGDLIVLSWVALFPLGYYFLSFPRERPILSLDRAVVGALLLAAIFAPRNSASPVPRVLRQAGIAWAAYVGAVLVSFVHLDNLLSPFRGVVDSFILPAVLGWYVVRSYPVRPHLRTLHTLTCVSTAYIAVLGALEIIRGEDLLPLPGAGQYYAGEGAMMILRPNGPFLASHSFVLISLMSFVFLRFLRRAIPGAWTTWQKRTHAVAITCAVLAVLMAMHRSGALTLLGILALDSVRLKIGRRRKALLALAAGCAVTFWVVGALLPDVFSERFQNPANLYARIAQQAQTLGIFSTHPLTGVGFANFGSVAGKLRSGTPSFEDVEAIDSPHNNLGAILAETGLLAFIPFVASQVLFALSFWRLRQRGEADARVVWRFFLYLFLIYWINGLNVSTIYSSDLNLWYLFTTAAIYRYSTTRDPGIVNP
jgi:hypothetical protein